MPTHTILRFLKFGQEDHIKNLYHNGTIYMNSIQYFREIEDGELRGDIYEGISRIKNLPAGQIEIPAFGFKGDYLSFQLRHSYESVLGNIFSLYCISSHGWKGDPNDFRIDKRNKRFGTHCLLINDSKKFISLMENKLNELKVKFHYNFIEYYDKDTVDREICLFEKPLEFEYQKEFRFYLERMSDDPFIFKIGSLADISEIYLSDGIIDTLELRTE